MLKSEHPPETINARILARNLAHMFEQMCRDIELPTAAQLFGFIRDDLDSHLNKLTDAELADRVDWAARSFRKDLEERYFFRVVAEKQSHYGADFGPEITASFPSAAADIREANTCFALERYSAAIFHSMRAVEVALRALAIERRTKPGKGPLAWQDWQVIITGIEDAVNVESKAWTRGPGKDAFLEFYRGALGEFHGFKDLYRNHVMHTRPKKPYGDREASEALESVERFLRRLAPLLTEKGKRIRWKKA
jgi:HEPN domain-containing protein